MKLRQSSLLKFALSVLVLLMVGSTVAGGLWVRGLWYAASKAQDSLQQLQDVGADPTTLIKDREGIEKLRKQLLQAETDMLALKGKLETIGFLLPLAEKFPVAGKDIEAAPRLVSMALGFIKATVLVLDGISPLSELASQDLPLTVLAQKAGKVLRESKPQFTSALQILEGVEEERSQIDMSRLSSNLARSLDLLDSYLPQLRNIAQLGLEIPEVLQPIARAMETLEKVEKLSPSLSDIARDWERIGQLRAGMAEIESQLVGLEAELETISSVLPMLSVFPGMEGNIEALPHLVSMGIGVSRAGKLALEGAERILEIAQKGVLNKDFGQEGHQRIDDLRSNFASALKELDEVAAERAMIRDANISPELSQMLKVADEKVAEAREAIRKASTYIDIGERLLGFDAPKSYLLMGEDENELRATGGFIGGAWIVTVDKGAITQFRFIYSPDVDDPSKESSCPPPPEAMFKYMRARCWFFRDSSWLPNFPDTAQVAQNLFFRGQGVKVDGVFAFTQKTVQYSVGAIGPLSIQGIEEAVDENNVLQLLFEGMLPPGAEVKSRPLFTKALGESLLSRTQNSLIPLQLVSLSEALLHALKEKQLLLYMNDEGVQKILGENRWTGEIPLTRDDYLFVVDSNVYARKVNVNIHRSVNYEVTLEREKASSRLTVTYENKSNPIEGLIQCIQLLTERESHAREGCYWNYLRIYVPKYSRITEAPFLPLSKGSLYYRAVGPIVDDTFSSDFVEADKLVLSGFFEVAPEEKKKIALSYASPLAISSESPGSPHTYSLVVQKQPGTYGDPLTVSISFPGGWTVLEVKPKPTFEADGVVSFSTTLDTDKEFEVTFSVP